jgi:hypothetical protein
LISVHVIALLRAEVERVLPVNGLWSLLARGAPV